MNFVRIVDKLVIDYNLARDAMVMWATTPNEVMGPILPAIGHFESCVNGLGRALRFSAAIHRDQVGPKIAADGLTDLNSNVGKRIAGMRNSIEHLDERLTEGQLTGNMPRCLVPEQGGIRLYREFIRYPELAEWIGQLHAIAEKVAYFKES